MVEPLIFISTFTLKEGKLEGMMVDIHPRREGENVSSDSYLLAAQASELEIGSSPSLMA